MTVYSRSSRCSLPLLIVVVVILAIGHVSSARAQELTFPRIIKIHYEAVDPHVGGQFIVWMERERIFYGLDPKISPAAKSVDVTYITPAPGSTTIILISVLAINSGNPDYFHLSGNTRFKISGMKIASSNIP